MEKLVREELERWDSEASMNRGDASPSGSRAPTAKSSRGSPSRASQASAGSARMSVSTISLRGNLRISKPDYKQFLRASESIKRLGLGNCDRPFITLSRKIEIFQILLL